MSKAFSYGRINNYQRKEIKMKKCCCIISLKRKTTWFIVIWSKVQYAQTYEVNISKDRFNTSWVANGEFFINEHDFSSVMEQEVFLSSYGMYPKCIIIRFFNIF